MPLFKKKTKKQSRSEQAERDETVRSARAGDVFTISGLGLEYEDTYFLIEKKNRYEGAAAQWHEILGVEGDRSIWVEWAGDAETITARPDERPIGIAQAGISERMLIEMDEEHSIDNTLELGYDIYHYENSGEAFYFEEGRGEGQGFYLWEFSSQEAPKILSVVKWEGAPFQVYVSEVLPLLSVSVYKR